MNTFFTGDTHFCHESIISHSNRPFANAAEMDRAMVDNWNAVVSPRDRVIHVGDFAVKADPKRLRAIFSRLNGQKFLVLGNHDGADTIALPWAAPPLHILHLTVGGQKVVCCHYGMRTWSGAVHGAIQLYGHSHGRLPGTSQSTDVGVDVWNFMPASLQQIKVVLAMRDVEPENERGGPSI